jgi:anaerobic magnesium-protoporphyrin IX monomethyl ester cyclase
MKIILFHPRGYAYSPKRRISALACIMPPLGCASIAAVLREAGHQVTIFDAALFHTVDNDGWARRITAQKPDIVGFSATTPAFNDARDVCRKVKILLPRVITVFGGVHVSWGKDTILERYPEIDLVVAGEGEHALRSIAAGEAYEGIEGLVYRDADRVKQGPERTTLIDLDKLPFPAYDLLEGFPRRYLMPLFGYPGHPGANIVSSRGCIYRCSYCDRSVFGKSFRWNSPAYMVNQIEMLHRDFGIHHFNFYDDLFTLNRKRVEDFCTLLSSRKLGITYNCIVRVGHIEPNLIHLLKWSGCWMVSVGIESGDQAILDTHKDGLSLGLIKRDIQLLYDSGLWVKGLFMMGFPGETEESMIATRDFALSLPLKDANMTAFTPFPGAPVSQRIHELGSFDDDWDKMDCTNFVFVPKEIGKREVLEHHYGAFYRAFYNRPFMRKHVYPAMLFQSPHSIWRLLKNLPSFMSYTRNLR